MPNEIVLITGASAGIGVELARLFANDGSDLVLVARRVERLEALAAELRERHRVSVRVLPADLARPEAPREMFEALRRDGVAVDVLVNNAGFGARGLFRELDFERQLEMIQVNVNALAALTGLFLPGMIERRRGGILNVASTAAFQPGPRMAVYYATKAFVLSLTEALAEELRGTGVRVSCLAPGPTRTEFGEAADIKESPLSKATAMSGEAVAKAGHRGFRDGKVLVIPGASNRILVFLERFLPRAFVRKAAGRNNE